MQTEDQQKLIEQIKTTLSKTKVVKLTALLKESQFNVKDLVDITFHSDKKIAFRAAWLLENLLITYPAAFAGNIKYLLGRFHEVKNLSCQRHYAKIATLLTSANAIKDIRASIAEVNLEPIVGKCFDWLIDPMVKVAVKAFAADALLNLSYRYDWVTAELLEQLVYLMKDGTAAIQIRGKRILEKLRTAN